MPKIGSENLNKNSLKNNVTKSEGGISSFLNWILRKNKWDPETLKNNSIDLPKCQNINEESQLHFKLKLNAKDLQILNINGTNIQKHQNLSKKSQLHIELKLNAKDLQTLKARGMDIKAFRNLSKINKKRQSHNNQTLTIPKDKLCLKENETINECIVPISVKKRKPVSNSKADETVVDPTKTISTNSKRVTSQKSIVNNLSYKVGIKSNTEIISQARPLQKSVLMESVPSKFLLREIEERKVIPTLMTQIKSMQEQLRNTELKTKKLNQSKQNIFKASSGRCDLKCKNSSLHAATPSYVSHKIYSKNALYSRYIKKNQRKKIPAQKKEKFILSSDQNSKTDNLKNNGYPFQNFKDLLNNFPIDYTKSMKEIFVGQTLLKSDCSSAKTDIHIDTEPSLKSLPLRLSRKNCLTGIASNEHLTNDILLKSLTSCDLLETAVLNNNVGCKGIHTCNNSRGGVVNQNSNEMKELATPLSEKINEPKINITIFIEDSLKKSVNVISSIAKSGKECGDGVDFCNIHYKDLLGVDNKRDDCSFDNKEHYMRYKNCPLVESNESTVNQSLKLKNNRINNEAENNSESTFKSNQSLSTLKSVNHIEDDNLQFGIECKYLYQKERKQLDELYLGQTKQQTNEQLDKQIKNGLVEPPKTYFSKRNSDFQDNKYTINHKPNYKVIDENCDMNYDSSENNMREDNKLTILESQSVSQLNKHIPRKSLLVLTDNDIEKLDISEMEGKQKFFRIINKNENKFNPVDKHIFDYSRKRSCRYGLTLSQEPILEESEDGISEKDMNYSECQSNKGDNIEIKSTDCECNYLTETMMCKRDIDAPLFAWLNRKDNSCDDIPAECRETSSVLVQTDWSMMGKSVNEIPKQTVSSQTDITMRQIVLLKNETINESDSCKYFVNDSQVSELVSCNPLTIQREEGEKIPSKYFAKKRRSLAIKMRKENITEVKLSDILISVVRDSENSASETSSNCVVPKNVVIVTANKVEEIGSPIEALISPNAQVIPEICSNQQMEIFTDNEHNKKVESLHECTARCFYLQFQESYHSTESQSEATTPKMVQDSDSTFSKTQVNICCDSITSDYIANKSTIEKESESGENHLFDNFRQEETIENKDSNAKAEGFNSTKSVEFRSVSSLLAFDAPFESSDNIKKNFVDELDLNIVESFVRDSKARAVTQQRVTMRKTHVLNDRGEIKSDNLLLNENITCNSCCVDCNLEGCALFNAENSSVSLAPSGCKTPENTTDTL